MRFSLLVLGLHAAGCDRHHIVLGSRPPLEPGPHLHVTCALEGNATDPLPVVGADDDLTGVRKTLDDALSAELAPWAERHQRKEPWELRLELFRAEARDSTVSLSVRATLSSVAQTRRECRE